MTTEERFWKKVQKTDTCWNWTGCILQNGYGQFNSEGKKIYAHRYSYQIHKGRIKHVIDHLCRNRRCVNPNHLEDVTQRENSLRGIVVVGVKKSFCIRGHKLSKSTRPNTVGGRYCKPCKDFTFARWQRINRRHLSTPN